VVGLLLSYASYYIADMKCPKSNQQVVDKHWFGKKWGTLAPTASNPINQT